MDKIVNSALVQLRPEFDKGNFDRVIELCNKILNLKSEHGVALFFRASSKLKKKLYKDSEEDFMALLPLSENNDQLHISCLRGLSTLYEELEDTSKLLETMRSILDHKINFRKNLVQKLFEEAEKISKLYNEAGKYQDSEAVMMKVVDYPGELPPVQRQKAIMYILTMNPYYKPKTNKIELCKKGIELDPKWEETEKLLNVLHDSATESIKVFVDKLAADPQLRVYWNAVLESAKKLAKVGKVSKKVVQCLFEYSLGLGNTLDKIAAALSHYSENAKGLPAATLFEYVKNRIKGDPVPEVSKGIFSPVFLYEDLFLVDQNMTRLKYPEALETAKAALSKIETIDKALGMDHVEIKEMLVLLMDTVLIKLNRFREFFDAFAVHSKEFPNCKELYQLYFEAAIAGGAEINVEKYLDEVCDKFPDWSWTLNTKAWLLYSQPSLTEEKLMQSVKLLEESIKKDKSLNNGARIRLATILWLHHELFSQQKEVIFKLWLEYAKGNPGNAPIFYCISLYLLIIKNDTQKAIKSLEKAVSLQPDFSPAGELLYILYMATGKHVSAIDLLEKVKDYNPVCHYSFYYLGVEQIRANNFDYAVDSLQNAIRLYYSTRKAQSEFMKADYPELNKELLESVFNKFSTTKKSAITKLHPVCSGGIMWLHLCHCYMEQANFEGAYNCANKALEDYLKYYGLSVGSGKTVNISGELSHLVQAMTDLNKTQQHYVAVLRYEVIEEVLLNSEKGTEDVSDLLNLAWNLAKTSFHLSLLKETLVYCEVGLKTVALLYNKHGNKAVLKYGEEFMLHAVQCGYYLIDQTRKAGLGSVFPYVSKYFKIVDLAEKTVMNELLQNNIAYTAYALDILIQHSDKDVEIKRILQYAEGVEKLYNGRKELAGYVPEAVRAYYKCYTATRDAGCLEKAKALAVGLVRNYPDRAEYWILMATFFPPQIRLNALLQALSLDPENETAWTNLAFHYYSCNDLRNCLKCLGEMKDLNPLSDQLHLCQALVYYSLWTDSMSLSHLDSAWGHVNEHLENASSSVVGWLLKGILATERKSYNEAYMHLYNVVESCGEYQEKHADEWKGFEYKYLKAALKSGRNKGLDAILDKISTRFKGKEKVALMIKNMYTAEEMLEITPDSCDTRAKLKKLNHKLVTQFLKSGKIPKCGTEVLEIIAAKDDSRAATTFLYLQFKSGMLNNDSEHCKKCIELISKCPKSLFKTKMSPRATEHLLKAEWELSKQNSREAYRELKLVCASQPSLVQMWPHLLRCNNGNETLGEVKMSYFKDPSNASLRSKLALLLVQSGSKVNLLSAIRTISAQNTYLEKTAKQIIEVYEGTIKEFTDDEIGTLLKIYTTIKEKSLAASTEEVQTTDLMNDLISKADNPLVAIATLTKSGYLLHSFGYHNSVIAFSLSLLDAVNAVFEKETEKDPGSDACKALQKYAHILIAVACSSLLHLNLPEKAGEILTSMGFSIAEDSVALNILYLQSLRTKLFNNASAKSAFNVVKYRRPKIAEKYLSDIYSTIQYLQLNSLKQFAGNVERLQQMLNGVRGGISEESYGDLPTYAKAYVEALYGIYMMKMVVFLSQQKEEYKEEEREVAKIQKKIDECLAGCADQLKVAIEMFPDPEFTGMLKNILSKFHKPPH